MLSFEGKNMSMTSWAISMRTRAVLFVFIIAALSPIFSGPTSGENEDPQGDSFEEIIWMKMGLMQDLGSPGELDDSSSDSGSVMFDGGMYKVWYSGYDGAHWRVLYSTSPDGFVWTKQGIAIDIGPLGSYDDDYAMAPSVLKNNFTGTYEMWYVGQSTTSFGWRILYANSIDGITWQKQGVVISKTPSRSVAHPNVHLDSNGVRRMWFSEYDQTHWRIGQALSNDGVNWNDQGTVLDIGAPGDPDSLYVYFPVVIIEPDGTHTMFYCQSDGNPNNILDIQYAVSPDGVGASWTKMGMTLSHGLPGDYDAVQTTPTTARLRPDGLYELWYTGYEGSARRMMLALGLKEMMISFRTSVVNVNDILLNWTNPDLPFTDHYLIYRSPDQRSFDFLNWTFDTSASSDPLERNWIDTDAAAQGSPPELYYVVRAVYSFGMLSNTSNTAGKWTKDFNSGLSTFSLPLEPSESSNVSWYADNVPNAAFIRWMDSTGHWVTHHKVMGEGVNDVQVEMGRGYEISLISDSTFTFCGYPASVIRYHEGLGDSTGFRTSLSAQKVGSNVVLNWDLVSGSSEYWIFRSNSRNGLHDLLLQPMETVSSGQNTWTDVGVLSAAGDLYYMVIPVDPQGILGSSTYSVGVVTTLYESGSDTFALPLKAMDAHYLDWYCNQMGDTVGMSYMIFEMWKFHSTSMPEGVYDKEVVQGEGYQISFDGSVMGYTFVGW